MVLHRSNGRTRPQSVYATRVRARAVEIRRDEVRTPLPTNPA